ncbi:MAG: trehalase family glycosidase [Bacteroidota bacterium]|nr:trehalase family glycosidase [Bacteroidota bacterium]
MLKFSLKPGESKNIRYIRGIQSMKENKDTLIQKIEQAKEVRLQEILDNNVGLFESIPRLDLSEKNKIIYLGAFNLARGCMLPPSGKTTHNFYVFSREPLWGWGHGHQVLHESLSMLTYAYLDAESAQNSQRVYMEQQGTDGLIAYRHGPRGVQDYPHYSRIHGDTMSTTSAPFYSWINWEIYQISSDREFLEDAYASGVRYLDWLEKNRDADQDGTFEWGPYGIIENVRDWYNAVFQVSAERYLDVDKEDISDELECLDLSLMVVNELRCLTDMALELGKKHEAKKWHHKAEKISDKINELMWDEESNFYYSVNRKDHSFKFLNRDLRRQEVDRIPASLG